MQTIVPHIWCNKNAEEVGAYYQQVFDDLVPGGATSAIESYYPEVGEGLADFQLALAGAPLTVVVTIADTQFTLIHAGNEFTPNPAISFMVNFDPLLFGGDANLTRQRTEELWDRLADRGEIFMPLDAYPFSDCYGWVQDRYGVSWQLILTDPEGEPRPFIMPALMFGGDAQNQAAASVDSYVNLFDDAELGLRVPYGEQTGPALPGSVMFSDFRIGDQWFTAMDSAVEQPSSFTPGVSLEVRCGDQAEIDRLWQVLSIVPEAEQCGWCEDAAGVSWQIVPANMGELMQRPNAYSKMMQMKKIVIDDF